MSTDLMVPEQRELSALGNIHGMQQIKTQYATALSVQKPRELSVVEKRCLQEADLAGESFFYGWGAGKDRIEGPSIDCAMSLIRSYGNCAIELRPVLDMFDSWIFTAAFVDLETGFTLERQFRQSKRWVVHGKHDEARKEDIRFQIGQSKAIRNVVLNALPKWLSSKMVDRAKDGVRTSIEKLVGEKGLQAVVTTVANRVAKFGITEPQLLNKFGRSTLLALTLEDLVIVKGDLSALEGGQDVASNLYPPIEAEKANGNGSGGSKSEQLAKSLNGDKTKKEEQSKTGEESQEQPDGALNDAVPYWLGIIAEAKDQPALMRKHEQFDGIRADLTTEQQEEIEAAFAKRLGTFTKT